MKKYFLIITILAAFALFSELQAQTYVYSKEAKPGKAEEALDVQVKPCLEGQEGFAKDFKFSEWTAALYYYNRKLIQRVSAEFAGDIAGFKPQLLKLAALSEDCEALKPVKKELGAIQDVFEGIKIEREENEESLFGGESVKATMKKRDAEDIIKQLDKLRKKLGIESTIIRIMD